MKSRETQVRGVLLWRRRQRGRGAGWKSWQRREPLLCPPTAPGASEAPDRWRRTTCRVSPPAKEHHRVKAILHSMENLVPFGPKLRMPLITFQRMCWYKYWLLKWVATGAKHIWLTNRSSFHLNHHSWMLPFSSKSLEMGHTEKTLSKKPWSHNAKTWILHKWGFKQGPNCA